MVDLPSCPENEMLCSKCENDPLSCMERLLREKGDKGSSLIRIFLQAVGSCAVQGGGERNRTGC